ncbi:ADP-ribosylglycohydrolase family protein, partial [Streptomyces yerevanensis]|uniref:ADP-ribosylglycohydrolase family protein n=1 Tax=Streptomyces yerevanensis TaxID=66378 RepID=UPI001FE15A30
AAIAGALLGARWGCSGIPLAWQQVVHGWPGLTGADLVRLAVRTARGGSDDAQGWPSAPRMSVGGHRSFAIPHPHDPGVVLGNLALAQDAEPVPVEAVVSLCRMGTGPVLNGTDVEHVRVWLVDSQGANANLHYVLDQAARQVLRLRQEGKRVLLHCLAGQSRTPAVAALYSHLATGTDSKTALNDLRRVLTGGWQLHAHPEMHDAVHELTAGTDPDGQSAGACAGAADPVTAVPPPAHGTSLQSLHRETDRAADHEETSDRAKGDDDALPARSATENSQMGGIEWIVHPDDVTPEQRQAVLDDQQARRKRFLRERGLDQPELDDATADQLLEEPDLGRDAQQVLHREFLSQKGAASRVRGMLLGLALGDTLGAARGKLPADGPLRAGVSTQLACFTAEGTIRALVRGAHKGICHPPSVVWHAYCRWAALQGIEVERMRRRWAHSDDVWPDGWLARVPVLTERRGSAPATVAALSKIEQGTVERPTTTSRGCHALTRTLPIAVVGAAFGSEQFVLSAREFAALTHGDLAAQSAAAHAAVLVSHCLTSTPEMQDSLLFGAKAQVQQALMNGIHALCDNDRGLTADERKQLITTFLQADDQPADPGRLAKLAPDATAPSALLGGLYVAASFPEPAQVHAALRFAAGAPDGDSVACVAGALLGAAHGVEALPVDLISRHELAWVLDTLARDLVAQFTARFPSSRAAKAMSD